MSKKEENLSSLSLHQASIVSGLHQDYLRFLCRTGRLAGQKIGRNWTTTKEALNEYLASTKFEDDKTNFPLHEASNISGLHQDYLRFLCRTGKLHGTKIGRNWTTTKSALWEFKKNYKNGLWEVVDETGKKIPVHVENPAAAAVTPFGRELPFRPEAVFGNVVAPALSAAASPAYGLNHPTSDSLAPRQNNIASTVEQGRGVNRQEPGQILQLNNLRKEVFENIENRIQNLSDSLTQIENKNELKNPETADESAAKRNGAWVLGDSLERQSLGNLQKKSYQPVNFYKVKEFANSFKPKQTGWAFAAVGIFIIACLALLSNFSFIGLLKKNKAPEAKPVASNNYYQVTNDNRKITNYIQNKTTLQTNESATKLLGMGQEEVFKLVDDRLNQYLAEGKFKGEPGLQGPQGVAGTSGAQISYVQPSAGNGAAPGSMFGVTYLSASDISAGNVTLTGSFNNNGTATFVKQVIFEGPADFQATTTVASLVVDGGSTLNGTTTIANLSVLNINPNFTQGSIVFQGVNGLSQDSNNLFYTASTSQLSVGTSTPNASALLELDSTSKGFLAPRMTQAERDAIADPAAGLMVYNIDTNQYNVYNGTAWGAVGGGGGGSVSGEVDTGIAGSFGYYPASTATIAPQSTLFFHNNNIGIGTSTPQSPLTVVGNALLTGNETLLGELSVTGLTTLATASITSLSVSGNVGIGTTSPSAKLDVNGAIAIAGNMVINSLGQWVGSPTGLVGPQGPAGATGATGTPTLGNASSSGLTVANAAWLSSTLTVTGSTTLSNLNSAEPGTLTIRWFRICPTVPLSRPMTQQVTPTMGLWSAVRARYPDK